MSNNKKWRKKRTEIRIFACTTYLKQTEEKSIFNETNYNYWSAVSRLRHGSQLTKFEGKRLYHQHVADAKTGFRNSVSCSAEFNSIQFYYFKIPPVLMWLFEADKLKFELF